MQIQNTIKNSKNANTAFDAIGCKVFAIPCRSPDVNPIKKEFNRIRQKLTEDAITLQIKRENFEEFSACVKRTFAEFPVEKMDKTIGSMQKQIKLIAKNCGERIKY